jgi:signal transduction histidine kinase
VTDIAHDPVETPSDVQRAQRSDNPLVRAVGRIPLPLGAKLLLGFAVVGALLAIGYALGLVALGQSNSRGQQLHGLQQSAAYARLLVADANQLDTLVADRRVGARPLTAYQAENQDILTVSDQFTTDAEAPNIPGGSAGPPRNSDPRVVGQLQTTVGKFVDLWGRVIEEDNTRKGDLSLALASALDRASKLVNQAENQAALLEYQTGQQSDALLAANHTSFANSRNLLIGVGTGSVALAVALGLLLSWSVVRPLRLTEERLDEIAAGDFNGRLDVANRDEIGRLAAKVNSTSDELERVHRELELASEHKSQFLANMSHELRTPLNAIIGFSEVLHEQMFGELNERQLAYVDDVLDAGRHLLSLINDVLDLAKIEAGRMELELSQVAIPDLLRNAVSMHGDVATRGGVELSLASEPAEIIVTADERRVRQVVFNLLSNAVKFTPENGRVDISARLDDSNVEVAVADTGPGIPAEDADTIFEEFEQTDEGRKAEGTGLGLPLSRKLVELHGGRLWFESEPGQGSTFHFTLPVQQEVA